MQKILKLVGTCGSRVGNDRAFDKRLKHNNRGRMWSVRHTRRSPRKAKSLGGFKVYQSQNHANHVQQGVV